MPEIWEKCGHPKSPENTSKGRCRACRKEEKRLYMMRYRQTEKGRAAAAKYEASEKGRLSSNAKQARYRQTERGRAAKRAAQARYTRTDKGRAAKRAAQARYTRTDKGRAMDKRYRVSAKGIFNRAYSELNARKKQHATQFAQLEALLNGS